MAKVVWLGSPEGPEVGDWGGKSFPKGESIEVDDDWGALEKISKNPNFKVEGWTAPEAKHDEPVTHRPPSEQSAQGPVAKGGEPIAPEGLQEAKAKEPEEAKEPEDTEPEPEGEHHPAVRAAMRPPTPRRR